MFYFLQMYYTIKYVLWRILYYLSTHYCKKKNENKKQNKPVKTNTIFPFFLWLANSTLSSRPRLKEHNFSRLSLLTSKMFEKEYKITWREKLYPWRPRNFFLYFHPIVACFAIYFIPSSICTTTRDNTTLTYYYYLCNLFLFVLTRRAAFGRRLEKTNKQTYVLFRR